MSLSDTLTRDLAAAMKARDQNRLVALRMLKTALTNRSIERGRALDEAEELQVVGGLVKQRRDAIEQFARAGRQDLVDKETAEIGVLETFLPPAASAADLSTAVDAAIASTGASGPKDMGRVMKAVMAALAGKSVDGRAVNEAVRARLSGQGSGQTA